MTREKPDDHDAVGQASDPWSPLQATAVRLPQLPEKMLMSVSSLASVRPPVQVERDSVPATTPLSRTQRTGPFPLKPPVHSFRL